MAAAAFLLTEIARAGLRPPAVLVGLFGLAVVLAVLSVPMFSSFAAAWHYPALISIGAWWAMALTQVDSSIYRQFRYRLAGQDPYVIAALERRDALVEHLGQVSTGSLRAEVAAMVQGIDRDMIPELAVRARRYRTLTHNLSQLKGGKGPLVGASPENLKRLQQTAADQKKALDGLVTRLSDMNVHLLGLSQDADQSSLVERAAAWADDLGTYWRTTAEVFSDASNEAGRDYRSP